MFTCATCGQLACVEGRKEGLPKNCPMRESAALADCFARYEKDGHVPFFRAAAGVEAEGYCEWPRLREIGEFSRRMGYKRLGVAFCMGLKREAEIIVRALAEFGLEMESIICKAGSVDKKEMGIPENDGYLEPGGFEAMCNPIAQAEFLNRAGADFNVVVGLCVGHDSLFYKYSKAPVTTLITKDRVLAHNPAGAVYCAQSYLKRKIAPSK